VNYSNGNYKHIDFDNSFSRSGSFFALGLLAGAHSELNMLRTSEGNYISIDLNDTINYSSGHNFNLYSNFSGVHNVGKERTDSSGNKFLEANRELVEELVRVKERRATVAEYSR
jgi:hypothetical protein